MLTPRERALEAACAMMDEEGGYEPGFYLLWYREEPDEIRQGVESCRDAMLRFAAREVEALVPRGAFPTPSQIRARAKELLEAADGNA